MAVDGQNEEGSIDGEFFDSIKDVFIFLGRGHVPLRLPAKEQG